MRCPSCNKFAAYDTETDPEIEVEVDSEGVITGTCRIVNNCAEDGEELKEANFDVEESDNFEEALLKVHSGEGHELEVEVENEARTEEIGNRYAKSYYGAEADFVVGCSCGETLGTIHWSDKIAASQMEELV